MRRLFAYPYMVWMMIFVFVPLGLVLYYAFSAPGPDGTVVFSLRYITMFFEGVTPGEPFFSRLYVVVAMRSLRLALQCTVITLIIGYPLAYILSSRGFSDKSFLIFLFVMPMWMNFLVRTYAWLAILERGGILNTWLARMNLPTIDILYTDAAVLLGMVYNFLPFMVLPIYTALSRMDKSLIEAAQDLGANRPRVFLRVELPLSIPGIISGITMVFMPAAATFIIPNLLGGGQYFLLGNLIEQQFLRVGNWHFGSAVAVVMFVLMLLSMAALSRFGSQDAHEVRI